MSAKPRAHLYHLESEASSNNLLKFPPELGISLTGTAVGPPLGIVAESCVGLIDRSRTAHGGDQPALHCGMTFSWLPWKATTNG